MEVRPFWWNSMVYTQLIPPSIRFFCSSLSLQTSLPPSLSLSLSLFLPLSLQSRCFKQHQKWYTTITSNQKLQQAHYIILLIDTLCFFLHKLASKKEFREKNILLAEVQVAVQSDLKEAPTRHVFILFLVTSSSSAIWFRNTNGDILTIPMHNSMHNA